MQRFLFNLTCALGLLASSPSFLMAQHLGDIDVTVESGKITTNVRVYGVELGETFDYYADEPGYDGLPGTFTPNTSAGFDILGALKVWNGTNFNTIATPRLLFQIGPATVLTPTTSSFTTGLSSNSNASGEWHKHFGMTLVDSTGAALPAPSPGLSEIGVYLIELQLRNAQPGIANSLPYYLVINNGTDELTHDAAIAYQQAVVAAVPEPGTWATMVCCLGIRFWAGQHFRRRAIPAA